VCKTLCQCFFLRRKVAVLAPICLLVDVPHAMLCTSLYIPYKIHSVYNKPLVICHVWRIGSAIYMPLLVA
jgi:hypothetical protein